MYGNRIRNAVLLACAMGWQGVVAAQDVSGITCSSSDWTVTTGAAFFASCAGELRVDASAVIEAGESITLTATGSLWMAGRLVAPRIELRSAADLQLTGGLFSGSADFYPDVNAVAYAGSVTMQSRTFGDLVMRPYLDPIYGAVTMIQHAIEPVVSVTPIVVHELILLDTEAASPVPEPGLPALFAAGLALLAWRARRRISHMTHSSGNPKVTLEN